MNAWQGKPNSVIQFYDTIDSILLRSKETGRRPEVVADQMVEERLAAPR